MPAAVRDRAPAALHRRGRLRRHRLRGDEPADDLGAARHGRLRPFGHRRHPRHPMARVWRCTGRASSPATLVARFGVIRITAIGLGLLVLTGIVGITGLSVAHFWTALVLLGLGWNLAFIGATTLVTECHRPEERTKVQSFNDFLIFGAMAVASFSSGQLLGALRLGRHQCGAVPDRAGRRRAAGLARRAARTRAGVKGRPVIRGNSGIYSTQMASWRPGPSTEPIERMGRLARRSRPQVPKQFGACGSPARESGRFLPFCRLPFAPNAN